MDPDIYTPPRPDDPEGYDPGEDHPEGEGYDGCPCGTEGDE
ncbi:hypothetical protein [Nocardiopsis dassonvillei]|nr:hypothetical protein [Nocardiopsis dassonvillei]